MTEKINKLLEEMQILQEIIGSKQKALEKFEKYTETIFETISNFLLYLKTLS